MSYALPPIGIKGTFKLLSPFHNLLFGNIEYTCVAVRKFEELILNEYDIYNNVYLPFDISKEEYDKDYKDGVSLITLKDYSGNLVSFPSNYLKSYPSGGVPYSTLCACIDLGSLPIDINLSNLQKKIQEVVKDSLGIESETILVQTNQVTYISNENHKRFTDARRKRLESTNTDRSKCLKLEKELEDARTKINALQEYILSNIKNE